MISARQGLRCSWEGSGFEMVRDWGFWGQGSRREKLRNDIRRGGIYFWFGVLRVSSRELVGVGFAGFAAELLGFLV